MTNLPDLKSNYDAAATLKKTQAKLTTLSMIEQVRSMALCAKDLADLDLKLQAAEILTNYLEPLSNDDDLHETLFSNWKLLIKHLSIIDPKNFTPSFRAESLRCGLHHKYNDLLPHDHPRNIALRDFSRELDTMRQATRDHNVLMNFD